MNRGNKEDVVVVVIISETEQWQKTNSSKINVTRSVYERNFSYNEIIGSMNNICTTLSQSEAYIHCIIPYTDDINSAQITPVISAWRKEWPSI